MKGEACGSSLLSTSVVSGLRVSMRKEKQRFEKRGNAAKEGAGLGKSVPGCDFKSVPFCGPGD